MQDLWRENIAAKAFILMERIQIVRAHGLA
jgi:hypothetical protein